MVSFRDAVVPDRFVGSPVTLEAMFGFNTNPYTQDWELEHADASRLSEFLAAYNAPALTDDDRFALMALCVASAHDALDSGTLTDDQWSRICSILIANRTLHAFTIHDWCCPDATCEDEMHTLTPRMRDVWAAAFDSEPRGT
ncbi:hypothetical protein Poly51_40460 [Rubripirellula tenax]|uniref:Uncharacterized protein n=1 Tax=Rubripirellula tenax TaxID=2528015 RepID=A0A5C6ELX5_9BACT|nr:hypothetical protein [Rubripirellula tenax]TWU50753.1 hypothetical protein Poly51_40460 [Rubripirellula tenax]